MYVCRDCGKEFDTNSRNKSICAPCLGKRGIETRKRNSWPNVIKKKKAKLHPHGYLYYSKTMCTPDEIALLPGANRTILVHRLEAAKKYNRPIHPDEVVMHVNGDKLDNSWENLQVGNSADNTRQHWDAHVAHEQWKRLAIVTLWAFAPR